MFIQTETTPNPATIKFIPGQPVMRQGTAEFKTPEDAEGRSPLAAALFALDDVTGVFLAGDFIAVTKLEGVEWLTLKPRVLAAIMDHYLSGMPVVTGPAEETVIDLSDEIVRQIVEVIDTRVRPAVARDGGDITFVKFDDGIVYLRMQGACAGCPSSALTLKSGIENMLRHFVPEVKAVEPLPL